MFKNTIPLGRWCAAAVPTRLVGCCQVLGLALLCAVLLCPGSAVAGRPAPPSGWTTVALNTAANMQSHATDINDAGDVVGELFDMSTDEWFAVLWQVSGTTVTEHVLADGSSAWGVNQLQQVVGQSGSDAAYWESISSPALILPPIASPGGGSAYKLNDQGLIVGRSRAAADGDFSPVAWRVVNGEVTGFVLLPGGLGEALDLTDNDASGVATIVGQVMVDEVSVRPVRWTVTSNQDGSLAVLSGPEDVDPEAVGYGMAIGINAGGDVCGKFSFTESTEGWSAVRAWNGGSLEILGQLNQRQPDDVNCAVSINDAGHAVGWDYSAKTAYNGVLWAANGSATQLVKLVTGWRSIYEARGINNQGRIAANSMDSGGRALVMIPPQ